MTSLQEQKIKVLLDKYNDILLISMRLAISEDFINLLITNRDDQDFELRELIQDKQAFCDFVMKEFFRKNSASVLNDLKNMDDQLPNWKHRLTKINK